MPKRRDGRQHAQRKRRGGRERPGRRLVAGNDGAEAGQRDEQKKRAQKADIPLRVTEADIFDLLLDADDDDFQQVLPARSLQMGGELARDELRAPGKHEHQCPREHNGAVEFEKPVLPEDHLIGTKAHSGSPVLRSFAVQLVRGSATSRRDARAQSLGDTAASAASFRARQNRILPG